MTEHFRIAFAPETDARLLLEYTPNQLRLAAAIRVKNGPDRKKPPSTAELAAVIGIEVGPDWKKSAVRRRIKRDLAAMRKKGLLSASGMRLLKPFGRRFDEPRTSDAYEIVLDLVGLIGGIGGTWTPLKIAVCLCLDKFADRTTHRANPSLRELAKMLGREGDENFRRAIGWTREALDECGVIRIGGQSGSRREGDWVTMIYRLDLTIPRNADGSVKSEAPPEADQAPGTVKQEAPPTVKYGAPPCEAGGPTSVKYGAPMEYPQGNAPSEDPIRKTPGPDGPLIDEKTIPPERKTEPTSPGISDSPRMANAVVLLQRIKKEGYGLAVAADGSIQWTIPGPPVPETDPTYEDGMRMIVGRAKRYQVQASHFDAEIRDLLQAVL